MSKFFVDCHDHQIQEVINVLSAQETFDVSSLQNNLAAENRPFLQNLYLLATQSELESEARLEEIKKTSNQIQIINIEEKITQLGLKIAQFEAKGEDTLSLEEETNQLMVQKNQLRLKKP